MHNSLTRIVFSLLLLAAPRASGAGTADVPPFPLASCEPISMRPAAAIAAPISNAQDSARVRRFQTSTLAVSITSHTPGAIRVDARHGDLTFRKVVEASGRYAFEIEAPGDAVSVAVTEQGLEVRRGGRAVALDPEMSPDQIGEVRRLIADSAAVGLLRRVGMELELEEDDSTTAVPLLLADAVVGVLSGDVGAPRRTARLLSRRARSQVRQVQSLPRPVPCYTQWEHTVLFAYMDLEECVFQWEWWFGWCSLRWTMQVDSAWFSFLTCMGFGG